MYHTAITREIIEQRVLHAVTLELTYACNLDCFYCYNDPEASGVPLAFEQYVALLEDLAAMQTLFLCFSGGEPMVHPRFFDLGEVARDLGFAVRVRTNGHTLTEKIARRLQQRVEPMEVTISLHGATAQTHDRQTRVAGSFSQLLRNLQTMKDLGIPQKLICTPTAWNEHEVEAMFDLADGLGIELTFQGPVGPRDNGDTTPLAIQPSAAAWPRIRRLQEQRIQRYGQAVSVSDLRDRVDESKDSKSTARACQVGRIGVDIDPFGNVYPCLHLRRSAGNLHRESIGEIWNGTAGRAVLEGAEQLSIAAGERFGGEPMEQFGAPVFCPALEVNCAKGCSGGACGN